MSKEIKMSTRKSEKGGAAVVVLVLVAIVAVAGLAFFSGKLASSSNKIESKAKTVAATSTEIAQDTAQAEVEAAPQVEITPGNPTVAVIDGKEIKRLDVFQVIQTLPPQARQQPIGKLFPLALDQVVNNQIVEKNIAGVNLDRDPEVQKQVAAAKEQIVKTVHLQNLINKRVTDERVNEKYAEIKAETPKEEEVKASHILVDDMKTAKEVVKKLQESGDFAVLAKEYSKDATKDKGGELGYFLRAEVVKPFADAAFGMKPGTYTSDPVKSEFGYHVIRVEDKRERVPPTLEEAKGFIEANLRQEILAELVKEWKTKAKIETFGINGDPAKANAVEPAAQ